MPSHPLEPYRTQIAELCQRYGVASLALFGSAARGDFRPGESDYDFLVELNPAASGSRAERLLGLADALEALLGAHVDLVNPRYIRNPYFAAEVARTRIPVYA
ncbi:nucleotidyltransferase family protein [Aquabacterium sp.]|uniref:nucleotidyltransferase family protein n=1 Tax=Aquabacterium sp. TaxID=1872578 RepID=UPI003783ED22